MCRPIMAILEKPYCVLSTCFFFYFVRVYQEAKSCNLYPGFCRLHRTLNSGTKGLIKLLDVELSVTYVRNSFIRGSRNVSLA